MEQLKHIGPKAHKWLLTMQKICFMENKIPTIWRQSKIIAILKPGKDSSIAKNYRPISLLCHTYRLYERMILNRVAPAIEQHLIKEQAGFRSGKSCTSQLLNLTQHSEDGYEEGMITGTALVNLQTGRERDPLPVWTHTCKKPSKVEKRLPYKCSTSSLPSKSCPSQRMEEKTGGEGTCRLSQPVRESSHGA